MFNKESVCCHVCSTDIKYRKGDPSPSICPVCGADLADPTSETLRDAMRCTHLKGTLGIGEGEMHITNKRLFWIARRDEETGNVLVYAVTGKKANTVPVNIPLEDIERIGDCKKFLRIGITVYTKSGESYNFFLENRGNPQILKDFLLPHVGSIFEK